MIIITYLSLVTSNSHICWKVSWEESESEPSCKYTLCNSSVFNYCKDGESINLSDTQNVLLFLYVLVCNCIISMQYYLLCSLSCVRLFANPWTVARQAPLSMGFFRQEYWSGLPFLSPGFLIRY